MGHFLSALQFEGFPGWLCPNCPGFLLGQPVTFQGRAVKLREGNLQDFFPSCHELVGWLKMYLKHELHMVFLKNEDFLSEFMIRKPPQEHSCQMLEVAISVISHW